MGSVAAAALPPSTRPSAGHFHHSGASSSTATVYMNIASILLRFPSSVHAAHRALATGSHIEGRGSLHGPIVACFASASSKSLSESVRVTSCVMRFSA